MKTHFPLFKSTRCEDTRTKDYYDDHGDLQRGSERNEGPPGGLAEDSSGVLQIHTGGSSAISETNVMKKRDWMRLVDLAR